MRISKAALFVLLLPQLFSTHALCADYVTIYGGPAYSSSTSTGYRDPNLAGFPEDAVDHGGTAVGNIFRKHESGVDKGSRAMRWDGTGSPAIELENLGLSSSGYTRTGVNDVNASGTAVGNAQKYVAGLQLGTRAVRWDSSGAATELESLQTTSSGRSASFAYAVNDAGTAVGGSSTYLSNGLPSSIRPVRWDATGTHVTELGNLGLDPQGNTLNAAVAINQSGTIAGNVEKYVGTSALGLRAVRWDSGGTAATELDSLGFSASGKGEAHVNGINDTDTVVGFVRKYEAGVDVGYRAVRWDGGGTSVTELGNLGLDPIGSNVSLAYAVNNSGTAVGILSKFDPGLGYAVGYRAVRWNAAGTAATELGNLGLSLGGFTSAVADAINEAGAAVGRSQAYSVTGTDLGQRAVYWGPDNVAVDRNTLVDPASGWSNLTEARGISDDGWISGLGTFDPDGAGGDEAYTRMFLLNIPQVPEPTSAFLALCGLVSLSHLTQHRARS